VAAFSRATRAEVNKSAYQNEALRRLTISSLRRLPLSHPSVFSVSSVVNLVLTGHG
jgi:hypothetical protein